MPGPLSDEKYDVSKRKIHLMWKIPNTVAFSSTKSHAAK